MQHPKQLQPMHRLILISIALTMSSCSGSGSDSSDPSNDLCATCTIRYMRTSDLLTTERRLQYNKTKKDGSNYDYTCIDIFCPYGSLYVDSEEWTCEIVGEAKGCDYEEQKNRCQDNVEQPSEETGLTGFDSETPYSCGNGIVEVGEDCDDGNVLDGDGCSSACSAETAGTESWSSGDLTYSESESGQSGICGDGILDQDEECDDGNMSNNDACLGFCKNAMCGDSFVHEGVEECDDGNDVSEDDCTVLCLTAKCGDAFLQAGEECDDGDDININECSNDCVRSRTVFATDDAVYSGMIDGLLGADQVCQIEAEEGSLEGVFRAWISDSAESPVTRFDASFAGVYKLADGVTVVAEGWAELTDGSLDAAIDLSAQMNVVGGFAWTNTLQDGTKAGANDCNGWHSEAGTSVVGIIGATDKGWTDSAPIQCAANLHLLCFQDG